MVMMPVLMFMAVVVTVFMFVIVTVFVFVIVTVFVIMTVFVAVIMRVLQDFRFFLPADKDLHAGAADAALGLRNSFHFKARDAQAVHLFQELLFLLFVQQFIQSCRQHIAGRAHSALYI